jgi:cytochrome c peroxidase
MFCPDIRLPLHLLFLLLFSSPSSAQLPLDSGVTAVVVQEALQPQFTPPAPGTYALPPIDTVSDHQLVDSSGRVVNLFDLTKGKIAVVAFMYTTCGDVGGCPLAAAVLQQVDLLLNERPQIAERAVLVSISFDPERDTPSHLAQVRERLNPRTEWYFLTNTASEGLQLVLDDFNQPVAKLWQEDGTWSGQFRHVLKVFLLDLDHQVRNIYSTGFFNAQLVLNDIETVLLEVDKQIAASQRP